MMDRHVRRLSVTAILALWFAAPAADDLTWADERVQDAPTQAPLQALQARFSRLNGAHAQLAYATSALAVRRVLDETVGAAVADFQAHVF